MTTTAVVTIGVFDGMHLGHQAVINRARREASRHRARLVVYSFGTHPQVVLSRQGTPPLLSTTGEKVRLLAQHGADEVRMLQFNSHLRAKGPRRFLQEHIFSHYRLARLVVGYDFAMGRERSGTIPVLVQLGKQYGFCVDRVGPESSGSAPVSSTRIRQALQEGNVETVQILLGRPYTVEGFVVSGEGLGSQFGFPTANIQTPRNKLYPSRGVYAAWVRLGGSEDRRPAVLNIGVRPTVGGNGETIEVHVIGYKGDLRGVHVEIAFIARLRDERKFMSMKELADQVQSDIKAGLRLLQDPLPHLQP